MTSDPLTLLLRHNHWANGVLLDRCGKVTDDQLHRKFEFGCGSLHGTLDHIFGCIEHWVARVRGEKYPNWHEKQSIEQLRTRNNSSTAAVTELIGQLQLTNTLDRTITQAFTANDGAKVDVTFSAGAAIVHCLVHGTHHRAQALNMLRHLQLGEPLPELDVIDWQHEVENTKA